ncbi:hypothetical protein [Fictibacillus barbaricus]|uniref:Uncharacterized protein n=1 Tax=Fictibacillus barbaricus TaxID=182136 RepID=A0ABU1U1B6_9BACL|nr:hypothetical protein [Fictibacillus barbaricus]MDR7073206.1 hypothetical protein [Fictibacillus barbaricus]
MGTMEKKYEKKKEDGALKEFFLDLRNHTIFEIIFEIVWAILSFIPRLLLRLVKVIFD